MLVKSVLRSMAKRGVYLTTTRIQKLFYLIERQCVLDTGERCFGLDYRYDQYGMYSPQLRNIMSGLDPSKDHLLVKEIESEKGMGRTVEYVENESEQDEIPCHIQNAITTVISEYGFLKTETLIKEAKATTPFIFAKKGEFLRWDLLLEERCASSEKLSERGLARLVAASQFKESRTFEGIDELNSYLFP
jgi:uncharacterized phage-associated protein